MVLLGRNDAPNISPQGEFGKFISNRLLKLAIIVSGVRKLHALLDDGCTAMKDVREVRDWCVGKRLWLWHDPVFRGRLRGRRFFFSSFTKSL